MNETNAKDRQPAVAESSAAPQPRAAYKPPILQVYGSIAQLTAGATGTGPDGVMMTMTRSDRRAKENIVRVGNHPLGVGLYLFDYKAEFRDVHGHGRQLGVMADEVASVLPNAVSVDTDGYLMVDYGLLARTSHAIH